MPWGNLHQSLISNNVNFEQMEQELARADDPALQRMFQRLNQEVYTDALDFIGTAYLTGSNGLHASIDKAMVFLYLAAECGSTTAQHYVGDCYAFGIGVPADACIAQHYYRLAAQSPIASVPASAYQQLQPLCSQNTDDLTPL